MILNVGDRVRLRTLESLSEDYDTDDGFYTVNTGLWVDTNMYNYLGKEVTVCQTYETLPDWFTHPDRFNIEEDFEGWVWDTELIAEIIAGDDFDIPDYSELSSMLFE